jgi:hypothetical protein
MKGLHPNALVRLMLTRAAGRARGERQARGAAHQPADLRGRRLDRRCQVGIVPEHDALSALQEMLEKLGLRVRMEAIDKDADLFHLVIRATGPIDRHDRAVRMMTADPRVRSVGRG